MGNDRPGLRWGCLVAEAPGEEVGGELPCAGAEEGVSED